MKSMRRKIHEIKPTGHSSKGMANWRADEQKINENPNGGMMKQQSKPKQKKEKDESCKWKLQKGNILVVEDAQTASLVIVARGLKDVSEKITALKEVLASFEAQLVHL